MGDVMVKLVKSAILAAFRAAVLALCLLGGAEAANLLDVRFGPSAAETRIVFDLDGASAYAISGDSTGQGRIFVDFSSLTVRPSDAVFQAGKGHVARYGFAASGPSGARAVLDLKTTAKIKAAFLIPPKGAVKKHRFVLDLQSADKSAFLESLPGQYADLAAVIEDATAENDAPGRIAPPAPSQKAAAKRLVIVIDPGHGGIDPGAQGQNGAYEKKVTLAAALQLAEILKKKNRYDVVLTRKDDSTLRPDRREALAREAGADLFISLHADAIAQSAVRGASVYTLSEQGSARSASVAKSQGNYHLYDLDVAAFGEEVGDILFDLAQDTTSTESSKFARALIANLTGKTPMLNQSHRTGDLRVLLAPDVPAVLLEMAFISNAKDEANLNSSAWRKRAMGAVAASIDQYFDERGRSRHAANRASGAQ